MTKNLIIIFMTLASVACKKNYQCECLSDRRGFENLEFSQTYKAKNNGAALEKCHADYERTPKYSQSTYCKIK